MSRRIVVETANRERGDHQWLETFNDSPSRGEEYDAVTSLSWNGPERNQEGTLRRGKRPKLDLPTYLNYWYYHIKWGVENEGMVSNCTCPTSTGPRGIHREVFPLSDCRTGTGTAGMAVKRHTASEDGSADTRGRNHRGTDHGVGKATRDEDAT